MISTTLRTLITLLRQSKLMVTTAESCTGGLVAGLLTDQPGSSGWFERGFVTYSILSKQEMLGVDAGLIQQHGAVSIPVAEAMALGALRHSVADLAVSVTGIAGPDGGTAAKPVGTVCFAFARRNADLCSQQILFDNISRQQIREDACLAALKGMISLLSV